MGRQAGWQVGGSSYDAYGKFDSNEFPVLSKKGERERKRERGKGREGERTRKTRRLEIVSQSFSQSGRLYACRPSVHGWQSVPRGGRINP